jgi:hypothetical protein
VTEGYPDEDEARVEAMIDDLSRAGALPEPPIEGRRMARLALEQIRHSHFLCAAFRHAEDWGEAAWTAHDLRAGAVVLRDPVTAGLRAPAPGRPGRS